MNAKSIVEDVLTPARARELWTANYFTALPFTPQHFEIGSLLPAMLYMARRGHRRGRGRFVEAFAARDAQGVQKPPSLADVAEGLLTRANADFVGFADGRGPEVLADLLLTYCLENREHSLGHNEQVQRAFATHYLASWLDLPDNIAHLRGVPELLTVLLSCQDNGNALMPGGHKRYPVAADFDDNALLRPFARHMAIAGPAANQRADRFLEHEADDIGVDELLAVRLAEVCGRAPDSVRGADGRSIANRWPLAKTAAQHLRRDLSAFIEVYASAIPRQALQPMLEAGIGLGLTSLLFSTTVCLSEWEQSGQVPRGRSLPLFADCSHGIDTRLRNASEAAMSEARARYDRLPVLMMLARVLDERLRHDPRLRADLPPCQPDPTAWIELLGAIYHRRHARSDAILDRLDEDCVRLAGELQDETPEVAGSLRNDTLNPALRLAEALVGLHGAKQQVEKFSQALDSSLMPNRPNGLAFKRRVKRSEAGSRRSVDLVSIVLSNPLLDFLVHRHLRKDARDRSRRPLSLRQFLATLRDHYGLYVDQEPPGLSVPEDLLRTNKQWLERRLRDLGLLVGVNDAEELKRLQPRFDVA